MYQDIKRTIRSLILFEERLDRLIASVAKHDSALDDHEKRLIRIETMIEMAQARRRIE